MIRKGNTIHCLLEKQLKLWQEEKFGLLIQCIVVTLFILLIIGYRILKVVLLSFFLSCLLSKLSVWSLSM